MRCNPALFSSQDGIRSENNAIPRSDDVRNVVLRPFRVEKTLFIHQVMYGFLLVENDEVSRAKLQGVDAAIFFSPFLKSRSSVSKDLGVLRWSMTHFLYSPVRGI